MNFQAISPTVIADYPSTIERNMEVELSQALETLDAENVSRLLKRGASLNGLSGKDVTEMLWSNHFKKHEKYDFSDFKSCLRHLYSKKTNDEDWIISSKMQLAFCIAQINFTNICTDQVNKFIEKLLPIVDVLISSEEYWNTKDESGKTANDYAKDCNCPELIEHIKKILR